MYVAEGKVMDLAGRETSRSLFVKVYIAFWIECLLFCLIQLLLVPAIMLNDSWLQSDAEYLVRIAEVIQWAVQNYPASFSVFNLILIPLMVTIFIGRVGAGIRPSRAEVGLMMAALTLLLPFQVGIFIVFPIS